MEATKIQWATHTFNPWIGCTKVAPGCANCYAEADMDKRRGRVKWGPAGTRSRTSYAYWRQPLAWNRKAAHFHASRIGPTERPRVFCASLADVFEEWNDAILDSQGQILRRCEMACHTDADDLYVPFSSEECPRCHRDAAPLTMNDLRADLFALIDATPNLDWLLLTKRPENIRRMFLDRQVCQCGAPESSRGGANWVCLRCGLLNNRWNRPNVWLLTSVSEQATADAAIPELLKCRDLAPVLGVSAEPLLGPIFFDEWLAVETDRDGRSWRRQSDLPVEPQLDWIIAGGESGANARPCDIEWLRSIRNQCAAAGVACFVKQLGAVAMRDNRSSDLNLPATYEPRGVLSAMRLNLKSAKGGDPDEWPADLRVRQFPQVAQ